MKANAQFCFVFILLLEKKRESKKSISAKIVETQGEFIKMFTDKAERENDIKKQELELRVSLINTIMI